jgi:hypothetical protein
LCLLKKDDGIIPSSIVSCILGLLDTLAQLADGLPDVLCQ